MHHFLMEHEGPDCVEEEEEEVPPRILRNERVEEDDVKKEVDEKPKRVGLVNLFYYPSAFH